MSLLEVRDLEVHFPIKAGTLIQRTVGAVKAVDGVDLDIEAGTTFGLVGESGCGKSTLGRAIMRLTEPTKGSVTLDGQDILALSERKMRAVRRQFQMVFQDPMASLDPRQSVESMLTEPLRAHKFPGGPAAHAKRIRELLDVVGLPESVVNRYPHEFSGGQRQRLGIARALALNPSLIIADEPVSALDVSIQAQVINLLKELQERFSLTYVVIAHDLAVVRHISKTVAVMYLGGIVEQAPAADLYRQPLHPYTRALMSAVPVPDPNVEESRSRILLQGDLPSPANPPAGCRFHTRCPWKQATKCDTERPALRELPLVAPGHKVACHYAEDILSGALQPHEVRPEEVALTPSADGAGSIEATEAHVAGGLTPEGLPVPADGTDVLVIGAGVVGAATAWYAARSGRSVTVVDRGSVAGGTTGAGEGNILVSDKPPGAELDLAQLSSALWRDLAIEVGGFEYDAKGGLVVASSAGGFDALVALARRQEAAGVETVVVPAEGLAEHEPHLTPSLAGGVLYPGDAQVQPMLAAARLLRAARARGARVRTNVEVTGFLRAGDRVTGVRTTAGDLPAGAVVNAAGTWGGEIASLAGVDVPVLPRRGFILVTEPVPRLVRHKVYAAEYVADVASDDADLQTSPVVEGTEAGTILIGASRERVGYDRTLSVRVLRALAAQAVALFPVLAGVQVIRTYRGFRPYCPDHLPVIGPDPRAPGLFHACGHEGAGIGLAAATGRLIAQLVGGDRPDLDVTPFRPERFA